jgi:hypothetical protein
VLLTLTFIYQTNSSPLIELFSAQQRTLPNPVYDALLQHIHTAMYATRAPALRSLASSSTSASLPKAVYKLATSSTTAASAGLRSSYFVVKSDNFSSRRNFSSTTRTQLKEYFPPADAPHIKYTPPAWHHPVYVPLPNPLSLSLSRNLSNSNFPTATPNNK